MCIWNHSRAKMIKQLMRKLVRLAYVIPNLVCFDELYCVVWTNISYDCWEHWFICKSYINPTYKPQRVGKQGTSRWEAYDKDWMRFHIMEVAMCCNPKSMSGGQVQHPLGCGSTCLGVQWAMHCTILVYVEEKVVNVYISYGASYGQPKWIYKEDLATISRNI